MLRCDGGIGKYRSADKAKLDSLAGKNLCTTHANFKGGWAAKS